MYNEVYRLVCTFLVVLILVVGCDWEQSSEQISETRLLLDTFCTITVHGSVDVEVLDEAFALCEELEALFSVTLEGSDVWRINKAGGEPVTVDPRTVEVIRAGLLFGELTDGMFDITIGRVSRLWDFGSVVSGETVRRIPVESEIDKARMTVDYRLVIIAGDTVQLTGSDAWIDLGAIAKGYIGEKVAEFLIQRGVSGALISLGGDVVAVGNRHDGNPWRIALRDPFGSEGEWLGILEITGASVMSSGTYERRFELDGVRYHHILDSTTGMPVVTDVVSATVIVEDAMLGEGLSTAAVLLGSEGAFEFFGRVPGVLGAVLALEDGTILEYGETEGKILRASE